MKRMLIVGVGGFCGRHLEAYFRRSSWEVVGYSSLQGEGLDRETGRWRGEFGIPEGTEVVLYLSQSPYYHSGRERVEHLLSVNYLSAVKAADLSWRAGVKKWIYFSTGSVYRDVGGGPFREGAPLDRENWYSLSKIHGEEALSLFRDRMSVVVLRLFGVYGPGQREKFIPRLVERIGASRPVVLHPREGEEVVEGLRISLCYIRDLAQVVEQVVEDEDPPFCLNVASDEVITLRQAACKIGESLGKEVRFELSEEPRNKDLVADIGRLRRRYGVEFTPFARGIESVVKEWLAGRGGG
ncbi:MAG: NAD(P)-dependent oxidoreductase [Planctomycetota bacterium]|nr:MAG: NAD(P)-dependent oxidoreductase [Planctomycetota bacterium]